mgnify:CR=1 FL=1
MASRGVNNEMLIRIEGNDPEVRKMALKLNDNNNGKISLKKYNIKREYYLGHSDIAPNRKKDPGEKFPWEFLSKYQIGFWHSLDKKLLKK